MFKAGKRADDRAQLACKGHPTNIDASDRMCMQERENLNCVPTILFNAHHIRYLVNANLPVSTNDNFAFGILPSIQMPCHPLLAPMRHLKRCLLVTVRRLMPVEIGL